jgi:hypothetical protein
MLPRAGAPGPQRGSAVDAGRDRDRLQGNRSLEWAASRGGRPRGCRAAGRACPASWCAPLAGYPTSNQTSGVACARILRCSWCRKTRTRACSRLSTSAMREAACSTLARRPSLISPQGEQVEAPPSRPRDDVSTRPGASPATIAPPHCPRPRRRIEKKAGRSARHRLAGRGDRVGQLLLAHARRGCRRRRGRPGRAAGAPPAGARPGRLDRRSRRRPRTAGGRVPRRRRARQPGRSRAGSAGRRCAGPPPRRL